MDRRTFLGATTAGFVSALLSRHAWAGDPAAAGAKAEAPARAIIVLWMNGGPSHIDTWDPKPGKKTGGPTRTIKTRLPGLEINAEMPRIAEVAHRLCVLRGMSSKEGNHQRAHHLLHTSYSPSPTIEHPSLGGWASKKLGPTAGGLPPFVSLGGPSAGAGFLGAEHGPFIVQKPGTLPESVVAAVDDARYERRMGMLDRIESRFSAEVGGKMVDDRRAVYAAARRLMKSADVRAFDLSNESAKSKEAYGDSDFGRACMTARNLVMAGTRFVEVTLDGWDTHQDNFTRIASQLRILDPAMSALLRDLESLPDPRALGPERRLIDSTLVLWVGDFGRTPTINGRDGRDHHPQAWSAVLAGAGIAPGVVGATDESGATPVGKASSPADLLATAASLMGLSPSEEAMSRAGRPIAITDSGRPIASALR